MTTCVAPTEAAGLLETAEAQLGTALIDKLSAPFVLSEPVGWRVARRRLVLVGQETAGWGGVSKGDKAAGRLRYWLQGNLAKRAEELAALHREFHVDPDRNTPFWRAHAELVGELDDWSVAWSNLMRVDTSPLGESSCSAWWNLSCEEVRSVCSWQRALHYAELRKLKPDAVIFFTGPNYDYCVVRTFELATFHDLSGNARRKMARVSAPILLEACFRTYHPAYLKRSNQWSTLTDLAALLPA